jgi:hypothetical protein
MEAVRSTHITRDQGRQYWLYSFALLLRLLSTAAMTDLYKIATAGKGGPGNQNKQRCNLKRGGSLRLESLARKAAWGSKESPFLAVRQRDKNGPGRQKTKGCPGRSSCQNLRGEGLISKVHRKKRDVEQVESKGRSRVTEIYSPTLKSRVILHCRSWSILTFTKDGPNSVKAFRKFRARSRVFFWRLPVCRSRTL